MADKRISDLPEMTVPTDSCFIPVMDNGMAVNDDKNKKIARINLAGWHYLTTQLTSTAWDGDSFSTTAKTKIDLSAVFNVPDGVKAVLVVAAVRDSASAANDCVLCLSPNNSSLAGPKVACSGLANDKWGYSTFIVPCDTNGDIYYQVVASGAGTLDAYVEIWGYWL